MRDAVAGGGIALQVVHHRPHPASSPSLEVSYSDEWGFVCDSGSWTMAEANVVCKQLGFGRGIRSTTQGMC